VATVYRALDRFQDVVVAVKVLRPELRRTPAGDAAFRSDLALAQAIRHRNLCGILDSGEHAGLLYLVMECVTGESLKQKLRGSQGLPLDEAFDVAGQLAAGLQALHEGGLVHQDVKPQNVMMDDRGAARLMDLDLAKRWGGGGAVTITSLGQLFDAPEYTCPEHARGAKPDERSDIYSLGCVLYELFTGHPPYRAATPVATALKHVHEPIPLEGARASRIPEPLVPVFRRILAKNPARRYPSAKAVASAFGLARTMSGTPARLGPKSLEKPPLPVLLSALNPVDATIRLSLAEIKSADPSARRAIPALVSALKHARDPGDPEEPLAGLLEDAELPPPVEVAPDPSDPDELLSAPPILSFVGSPGSIEILIGALKERDGQVRSKAARALGGIGPGAREAIPVLLEALRDREAHVRWDAARALGQIGAAAAEGLAAAVHDKDPVVRQIAADALKRIIQRKRESQGD
jgi:serine/threonine protein kinase